ncbi:MAG: flagellin, partial [Candidatus Poribacteria bacterium]
MAQADFTRISTNIAALNNLNSLRSINTKLGTAQLRLATGKRINQAADDPAGLTIAMKLSARNEGLKAALGNIGDAKNMLSVAEGGLQQINDLLIEMKAKATQAASDTLGADERDAIRQQLVSLAKQINDIVDETRWNNSRLLDGSVNKTLQTGATNEDTTQWMLRTNSATATTGVGHNAVELGVASGSATGATLSVVSGATVGSSFATTSERATGVRAVTGFDDLIELDSGTYKFRIADKATSATLGKFTALSTISGLPTITQETSDAGHELASGIYKLKIDAASGATASHVISYTITDS